MSRVYILLPVHNRKQTTARFIDCLQAQTHGDYRLVLIDDGSTDGSAGMVEQRLPGSVILQGDGKHWWAGSLQLGYDWLRSAAVNADDLVLIINDDTRVEADFIATGISLLGNERGVMLHAQCRDEETDEVLDDGVRVDWRRLCFSQVHDTEQVNCLSTRGLFMRVTDFLASGGFRPRLLPHYLSDYEFTIRAQRQGLSPLIDPRLRLWTQWRSQPAPATGLIATWRGLVSKKNPSDPYAWIMFVALACPWPWKPLGLLRVCKRTLVRLVKPVLGR
jgi:GT2 family glycosyltransferase